MNMTRMHKKIVALVAMVASLGFVPGAVFADEAGVESDIVIVGVGDPMVSTETSDTQEPTLSHDKVDVIDNTHVLTSTGRGHHGDAGNRTDDEGDTGGEDTDGNGGGTTSGSSRGSSVGGSLFSSPIQGEVLGASTSAGEGCSLISTYLKQGLNNDRMEMVRLQFFLTELGFTAPLSGTFDDATLSAVKAFQGRYASEILAPWGTDVAPTGYVYVYTKQKLNNLFCSMHG